jgi:2'-5' RNA ligase
MIHFLALRLADEPRDRLAMIAERLQAWQLPAAWVHPEDYHLTLAYIGELDDDEVRVLPHVIGDVAGSLRRPELRFSGLGAQGGRAEPRVVFAALDDPEHACAGMHADLCAALDLPARRQFSPHVTLCRPRTSAARELAAASGGHDWPGMFAANGLADWGACPTTDLVLYQSAGQQQIRYRALARWPLVAA